MHKPERGKGPLRQTDRQTDEGREEAGERLGLSKRGGERASYLPTWGCRPRRLSAGVGVASMRVTGWLRA